VTEWIALGTALISAIGLLFAGQQVRQGNKQTREERSLSIDGVVVSWHATIRPVAAEPDGTADWTYKVTVANPGKFAIDEVAVKWIFSCDVKRVHHDGTIDNATNILCVSVPVLAGGAWHTRTRTLRINFDEATKHLPETRAEVTFRDVSSKPHTNHWPRASKPRL
jgi:hypothetical protein